MNNKIVLGLSGGVDSPRNLSHCAGTPLIQFSCSPEINPGERRAKSASRSRGSLRRQL